MNIRDNIRKEIMLAAKTAAENEEWGGINFSPVIKLWFQRRQTLNIIKRRFRGHRLRRKLILQEEAKTDISHPLEASLEEEEIIYKLCCDEVSALQAYDEIMRHGFLYH